MQNSQVQLDSDLPSFLLEYERLANARSFEPLVPFIDESALFWFSNGSYCGIGQIRRAFEETWEHIQDEKYTIRDIAWLFVSETEAVCTYHFDSDGLVDGVRQVYSGRGTNVFQKKDGVWKITHEHLSKMV